MVFLARCFFKSLLKTRIRRIQSNCVGQRALAVPFLFPIPVCRPLRLAASLLLARNRECTTQGFFKIIPFLMFCLMDLLEDEVAISLSSLGSNQTLFLPQFKISAASRFWSLNITSYLRKN